MSKKARRLRLFGGEDDKAGGGMPMASMVSQILNHVYDNGPTPIADLVTMVEGLHHKRERLEYIYHKGHQLHGDAYALFLDDLTAELADAGVLLRQDDRLALGPRFELRIPLPLPDAMGARVFPKDERELIGKVSLRELEIKSLAYDLTPDRPGIRKLNPDNVARLAESMRAFGYLPQFPVFKDQHGRILSGRHRMAAAKEIGIPYQWKEIKVASDLEAVAIAYIANQGVGFSKKELELLAKRLAAAGFAPAEFGEVVGNEGKRDLIRYELLLNPKRSNRSIADALKVDDHTVEAVRRELHAGAEIPQVHTITGSDAKNYPASGHSGPSPESMAGRVLAVVNEAKDTGGVTMAGLRERLPDIDPNGIRDRLSKLTTSGRVQVTGPHRSKRYSPVDPATDDQSVKQSTKHERTVAKILELGADLPMEYRAQIIQRWQQTT